MINELIELATHLDKKGHYREANYLDAEIRKFAKCASDSVVLTVHFDRGESRIDPTHWTPHTQDLARCLIESGMSGYDYFIDIRGGTSGTCEDRSGRSLPREDCDRVNIAMMSKRISAALKYLEGLKAQGPLSGGFSGDINTRMLRNKANINYDFDLVTPESVVGYVNAPDDPDDPFYKNYQFVEITINALPEAPAPMPVMKYGRIANEFMEMTVRTITPNYSEAVVAQRWSDQVYNLLLELDKPSDKGDGAVNFWYFNQALRDNHKTDFYKVACQSAVSIPGWLPWTVGPVAAGIAGSTPKEIGEKALAIQELLRRWGHPQIKC